MSSKKSKSSKSSKSNSFGSPCKKGKTRSGKPITKKRCCNTKKDRLCHFKKNIDLSTMRKEYKQYKNLEKKLRNESYSPNTHVNKIRQTRALREQWLQKYYRDECRDCDGDGVNHEGAIMWLDRRIGDITRKQRSNKSHSTRRNNSNF